MHLASKLLEHMKNVLHPPKLASYIEENAFENVVRKMAAILSRHIVVTDGVALCRRQAINNHGVGCIEKREVFVPCKEGV